MWSLLIGPIATVINTVLTRVLPGEKMGEKDRAVLEKEILLALTKMDSKEIEDQLQINLQEAKHENIFVAGWRPFVGWTCGSALAYHYCIQPLVTYALVVGGFDLPVDLPVLDLGQMMPVLMGMLGLGAMRSFEKFKKANKNR